MYIVTGSSILQEFFDAKIFLTNFTAAFFFTHFSPSLLPGLVVISVFWSLQAVMTFLNLSNVALTSIANMTVAKKR